MVEKSGQASMSVAISKAAELELLEYFGGTEVEGLMKCEARFLAEHIAQRALRLLPVEP